MSAPLRILLLSGSLSNSSHTRVFLEDLVILVCEKSGIAYVWDPHLKPLPILNLVYYRHPRDHESKIVQQLAQSADQADAFVLGTRVYHNSFSGILKNALDHLHPDQFRHNPVALINHSHERSVGQPCNQLRIVAQSLLAPALPIQFVTTDGGFGLYQDNNIVINSCIEKPLIHMANELVEYSLLMRELRESFL